MMEVGIQDILYGVLYFYVIKVALLIIFETAKELFPAIWVDKYGVKQGKWAIVTGATDGIGLGFVQQLAFNGCNVVLISRNEEKLKKRIQELKQQLSKNSKPLPKFMYIVADFKNSAQEGFTADIVSKVKDLPISILVNNVGTSQIQQIEEYSAGKIIEIINVNCTSMVALTSALAPYLDKQASAMINLSSFMGQNPAPYACLYSSTKAFNTFFSEGISMQKQLKHIDILSARPLFVESPLSKAKKGLFVPDRRQFAQACMKELRWGYETNGCYRHRIIGIVASIIPKFVCRLAAGSSLAESEMKARKPQ